MTISGFLRNSAWALVLSALALNVEGAPTTIATAPLATSPSTAVLPNIMYVLDDSGSMDWDFLPDWACNPTYGNDPSCQSTGSDAKNYGPNYLYYNNGFNGVYYNPAIVYTPPTYYTSTGAIDTTTYPSMTGTSAATGGTSWSAVPVDGYGRQSTSTRNLVGNAFYWTMIAGEYCNGANLTNCTTSSAPTGSYTYPATLRWCNGSTLTNCKATFGDPSNAYIYFRAPAPPTATITLACSSCNATSFSGITVNGAQIMSATSSSSSTSSTVATSIVSQINACTYGLSGNCTTVGYSASRSGSTVTITAPSNVAGNSAYTPVVATTTPVPTTPMTATAAAFAAAPYYSGSTVPGSNLLTVIQPGNNSYVYPGTAAKATSRTDCTTNATTCTYAEEMTNYANWYAYYHTRMQMMKTAASNAFATIGTGYQVGYMSISTMNSSPNTDNDFRNPEVFNAANKLDWYTNFFNARPGNSTPNRVALAQVGRYYAGMLDGTTINGVAVSDPIQFSCQQNFSILSTDGYWNEAANPKKLNGTTDIGQQDGYDTAGRPYIDGASVIYQKSTLQNVQTQSQALRTTSQVQQRIQQVQSSTGTLQKQTSQLQKTTSQLQAQTSQLQKTISQLQAQTSQLQIQTSSLQTSTAQLQKATSSNSGATWSSWSNVSSCTWDTSTSSRTKCQYDTWSAWTNAAGTCTVKSQQTSSSNGTTWSGNAVQCQYGGWSAWTGTSSCTAAAQSSGSPYSVVTAKQCRTVVTAAYASASSCLATTTPDGSGNTKQCQYAAGSPAAVSSCTAVAPSSGPNYTVANPVACNTVVTAPYTNGSSCTATTTPDGSGNTQQCQYAAGATAGVSACTPVAPSSGPAYTVTNPVACNTVVTAPFATASSCTATTTPDASGNTTQCQYAWSAPANASSCTAVSPSTGPIYTVGTAKQCSIADSGSIPATGGVCTPSGPTSGKTVTCPAPVTTGPTPVASCTPALASSGNSYTATTCSTNPPTLVQTPVATCTPVAPTSTNGYLGTSCSTNTTGPTSVSSCTAEAASSTNNWTATTCSGATASGGTSNTLADVAEYYYLTDLRTTALGNCTGSTGNTLCSSATPDPYNNVPTSGLDSASWQHMTTFTLGLGAPGYMQFSPTYKTDTSGDFFSVKNGTLANPASGVCTWQSSGSTCNWPAPLSNTQSTIDDLWHTSVTGRGAYFSATNPLTLTSGLATALAGVSARVGASAAATTSNPNITSGDNFVFSSTFTTSAWTGDLVRQQLDLTTGVASSTIDWSAATKMAGVDPAARTIYTFSSGSPNNLKSFTWSVLSANADGSNDLNDFNAPNISSAPPTGMTGLSQFCASGSICLSAAQQTDAQGQNLVNFLRGDNSNEATYYRIRASKLGDIVDAEAVYVKTPLYNYADAGYLGAGGYVALQSTRAGMVYAAANDGMLHAFDSTSGVEQWAYIPHLVLPNLYKLADVNYSTQHTYYLDGTPVAGDICPTAPATPCTGTTWETILVGGLNRGGRGYYALDVTDPTTPKALWEFTDPNMGFTFGNPEIAKLADGTWVVLVASGYDNIASTSWPGAGDGVGRLYVLNAATGALINTISTGVGDATTPTPSGLARIRAYADNAMVDNTALMVYGGDLLGNLWRFDINNTVGAAGTEAQKLVTLYTDSSGAVAQPITARPEVGDCGGTKVVFVGTGEFLGQPDIDTVPPQQSFYGIKDTLGSTSYGNPQASSNGFVQQTLTSTSCPAGASSSVCLTGQSVRTASNNAVNLATKNGWYLNLPDAGERDNTDPTLGLATLAFNTNVPSQSSCTIGGYSYRYFLNYCTGAPVNAVGTSGVVSVKLGNALATRPVFVRLPNNAVVELTRTSDGTTVTSDVPIGTGIAPTRRVSWRELINDQ